MEIYLDNASTTKLDEKAYNEMQNFLDEYYGNDDSPHHLGKISKQAIVDAKENIANMMGVDNLNNIYFTSSGAEANTWAVTKVKPFEGKKRIVSTVVEHQSIYLPLKDNENATLVGVDKEGLISLSDLENELKKEDVYLVSVQYGNSETGVIQPIEEISKLCKQYGALFHVDACQAFGKVFISAEDLELDFMSVSAHKIYGPKGIGSLYIKDANTIEPLIYGAYQQNKLRGGSLNIGLIVAFGEACSINNSLIKSNYDETRKQKERFFESIRFVVKGVLRNGSKENCLPHILSLTIPGVDATSLVTILSEEFDICISCGAKDNENPSYVLREMGLSISDCFSTIRISLGKHNLFKPLAQLPSSLQIAVKRERKNKII